MVKLVKKIILLQVALLLTVLAGGCTAEVLEKCGQINLFNEQSPRVPIVVRLKENLVLEYVDNIHGANPPDNQVFLVKLKPILNCKVDDAFCPPEIWLFPNSGEQNKSPICEDISSDSESFICGFSLSDEVSTGVVFKGILPDDETTLMKFKGVVDEAVNKITSNLYCE